jgi:hypothetical protein
MVVAARDDDGRSISIAPANAPKEASLRTLEAMRCVLASHHPSAGDAVDERPW